MNTWNKRGRLNDDCDPDGNGHVYTAEVFPFPGVPVAYKGGQVITPTADEESWLWRATDIDGKNPPIGGGPYPPDPMPREKAVAAAEAWLREQGAKL